MLQRCIDKDYASPLACNDSENLRRFYSLHDDDKQLIVIGSLPDHLGSVKIQ